MASSTITSTLAPSHSSSNSPFCLSPLSQFPSPPIVSFSHSVGLRSSHSIPKPFFCRNRRNIRFSDKARTLDFSGTFFEGEFRSNDDLPYPPRLGRLSRKRSAPVPTGAPSVLHHGSSQCPPLHTICLCEIMRLLPPHDSLNRKTLAFYVEPVIYPRRVELYEKL